MKLNLQYNLAPSGKLKIRPSRAEFTDIQCISTYFVLKIELAYTWTQAVRATVEFQILTHVPMHLHLLWASDSLVLLSMLAILPADLHNTYNFILLLFPLTVYCCASFPSYSKRVWQTLPLPMTFTLLNLLLPLLPWFFCCLPSSSAGKKNLFFWLRFWLLFFLNSHILFNFYWLFLAVVHTHWWDVCSRTESCVI